jgi:GxxExxY protein
MTENEIATEVIGAAIEVHRELGPGLLERIYEKCLIYELREKGLQVQSQVRLPVEYKGMILDFGFRADLIVENKIIVEIKSSENMAPVHMAQTLTYIKLCEFKLGLLINFNNVLLKDGVKRVVNGELE